jgi:hypothetical protein
MLRHNLVTPLGDAESARAQGWLARGDTAHAVRKKAPGKRDLGDACI